ncbi:MAG: hypothetical protein WC843_05795 [Candidatus Gracilibacteria bacterium]|jgi:hypothetical protein
MPYEQQFFSALALTVSLELAAGIILIKMVPTLFGMGELVPSAKGAKGANKAQEGTHGSQAAKARWLKIIFGIILASTLTLPYVWFLWPFFFQERITYIIISELWAWLMEAIFYRFYFDMNWKKALTFSFILNACSFLIGLVVMW